MIRSATVMLGLLLLLLASLGGCTPSPDTAAGAPIVLAASSLQESLEAAADAFAATGHARPVLSFAASSALARQIDSGAPADLFISADGDWMDHVAQRGLIDADTRANLLGNALVLIAPRDSALRWSPGEDMSPVIGEGRIAMADPDSVPAGKYAKAALGSLNQWEAVQQKAVRAENVRAALAFVERGEAVAGLVYATDAAASAKVRVVATFPAASHPAIVYPVARLAASTKPEARAFEEFLRGPQGQAIFRRYGFTAP
ncbi:MAG: molybdate ABC transporter substrate-binding protein [Novosphingopyxis baekryungensis]|nr:molybdate ABC transporter substrate-binding protein [Novosphingopyxis baekryungensis]